MPVGAHGGALVDRFAPEHEAAAIRARAGSLPRLELDSRELADLELIASGAASPLVGFLAAADYASVLDRMRLSSGVVWPLPLTLAVEDSVAAQLRPGGEAALYDAAGRLWGVLEVGELFSRDPLEESRKVLGTEDPGHPGVAYLLSRPRQLAGGAVRVLPLPPDLPFASHRLTPRALRDEITARGWRSVAGFQTRNPIHRAHEHLTKLALEQADGLVIHPLVGNTKDDDVPAAVRLQCYEALISRYYPAERTLLAVFPAAMRYAGPREALFHALVRKNYGIDRLIVGRDHAGVGRFYGAKDAQRIFDRFPEADLGVRPLRMDPTFFCRLCDALTSERACPHGVESRLELSGTRVRELLSNGGRLPEQFTRPEVAVILRSHYAAAAGSAPHEPSPEQARSATRRPAFVLWFTGFSGAGKSTLAAALKPLIERDVPVEILDGDEFRLHLSQGLGFSKEDRDTNIRRLAFVARLLARNGVVAVAAAISPYAATRAEVKALAEREGIAFVEVFTRAELEALIARDPKGLYKKALSGEIAHFTGISDPYEAPAHADVVVRTDVQSVEESTAAIVEHLAGRGLIGRTAPKAQ
jgi:sulfate adenylyltransferase